MTAQTPLETLIEIACKAAWKRDYPQGGITYKTYESTHFHDKEIYRKEVTPIVEAIIHQHEPEQGDVVDRVAKAIEKYLKEEQQCALKYPAKREDQDRYVNGVIYLDKMAIAAIAAMGGALEDNHKQKTATPKADQPALNSTDSGVIPPPSTTCSNCNGHGFHATHNLTIHKQFDICPVCDGAGEFTEVKPHKPMNDTILVELMLRPMLEAFYQNINWDSAFEGNDFWKPEVDRVRAAIFIAIDTIRPFIHCNAPIVAGGHGYEGENTPAQQYNRLVPRMIKNPGETAHWLFQHLFREDGTLKEREEA